MECVPLGDLCVDGGSGGSSWCSLQQSQHQPYQVSHEIHWQQTVQDRLEVSGVGGAGSEWCGTGWK